MWLQPRELGLGGSWAGLAIFASPKAYGLPPYGLLQVIAFPLLLKRFSRSAGIPARTEAKAAAGCGTQKCRWRERRRLRSQNDC
jgi:hypothetical protein